MAAVFSFSPSRRSHGTEWGNPDNYVLSVSAIYSLPDVTPSQAIGEGRERKREKREREREIKRERGERETETEGERDKEREG